MKTSTLMTCIWLIISYDVKQLLHDIYKLVELVSLYAVLKTEQNVHEPCFEGVYNISNIKPVKTNTHFVKISTYYNNNILRQ